MRVHEPLRFDVLAEGLGFPEGPVIEDDGSVLVVDIDGGRVLRVAGGGSDTGGGTSVVAEPGGGPNGLAPRRSRSTHSPSRRTGASPSARSATASSS
jgi:sugar lactone lactonase YvrE